MATGTWIEFLKKPDNAVWIIHLAVQEEEHLNRLRKRRAEKKGMRPEDVEMSEKTRQNVATKRKTFSNLYRKMKPLVDYGY
jgi:thymidylate kinase